MRIRQASPQETFDHMLGSGATSYSWWLNVTTGDYPDKVPADWEAILVCEDGNDGTKSVKISHESVMESARELVRMYLSKDPAGRPNVPDTVVRECAMLLFEADEVDFDADSADCLLQLMVLGEIVFS